MQSLLPYIVGPFTPEQLVLLKDEPKDILFVNKSEMKELQEYIDNLKLE